MDDDVSEAIMLGTYRALCEHGFADLTMQDIAEETDKSKAALHYHYDTKQDLLLAFLEFLYEEFTGRVCDPPGETPRERLTTFVEMVLTPPEPDDHAPEAFGTAILELKAQAPYDPAIRDQLEKFDSFLYGRVRDYVEAGIDSGEFQDVDPDEIARFVVTVIDGARVKQVAVGQDLACTRRMLRDYVENHLVVDTDSSTESLQSTDAGSR